MRGLLISEQLVYGVLYSTSTQYLVLFLFERMKKLSSYLCICPSHSEMGCFPYRIHICPDGSLCGFQILFVNFKSFDMFLSSNTTIVSLHQDTMRAPSLIAQCLPGLMPHDSGSQGLSTISEKDVTLPYPAVEIIPSKVMCSFTC